jgi:hypothetical protein
MSSPTLITSRRFVTRLLSSVSAASLPTDNASAVEESNPLDAVPDAAKKQLLALQVLFPNEFVAALDLLDRRLVVRFRICEEMPDPPQQHDRTTTQPTYAPIVYYVRSAQARAPRFATSYDTTSSYEVRLRSWNCSCPAFAFSAFPPSSPPLDNVSTEYLDEAVSEYEEIEANERNGNGEDNNWIFGGTTPGHDMPSVCKHLLACVLVERCKGLFGGFVEERRVGWEEAAGWAAGWGD